MKIDKLEIKNFKFFDEVKALNFESKNVLVYGENGSGKSTIYWALYTLLQSSKKDDEKIKKYFTHSTVDTPNNSSLVNIYADENDSKIEIFVDEDRDRLIISKDEITIKDDTKLIEDTLTTSDFINYKYLFRFFNFLHRDNIDLFTLFEYEVLHFLQLNELWIKIIELEKNKPRVRAEKEEYINLQNKLTSFNNMLSSKISDLNEPTNRYLEKFNYHNIRIFLSVKDGIYLKQKFNKPQINIELSVLKSDGSYEAILRPQSYFNEAKLTAIALSVRLAITEIKLKDSPLKLLVLDDLLVSLDMSNGDKVVDILLKDDVLKEYQKIILTHDKAFFEMAKQKFNYKEKGKWKYFEMYLDNKGDYEKPLIKDSLDYFQSAIKHFNEYDYPACANYLRKEVERLKKIKEKQEESINKDEKVFNKIKKMLLSEDLTNDAKRGGIIGKLMGYKKAFEDERDTIVEIDLRNIKSITDRILNPQSHDDTSKPLYKKELEEAIDIIRDLRGLLNNRR